MPKYSLQMNAISHDSLLYYQINLSKLIVKLRIQRPYVWHLFDYFH